MKDQSRRHLTVKQQYDIDQLLTKSLENMQNGIVQYKAGQNDYNIAEATGASVGQVQHRRREIFGELKPGPTDEGRRGVFFTRVAGIESRLADANLTIADLDSRVRALEDAATAPKKTLPIFNTSQPWKSS